MMRDDALQFGHRCDPTYLSDVGEVQIHIGPDLHRHPGVLHTNYKIKLKGRGRLNGMGTSSKGRVVAYKNNKKFVRMDIPYPMQLYYTAPNVDKAAYTTYFVGQASLIQLPYNDGTTGSLGAVTYWDLQ